MCLVCHAPLKGGGVEGNIGKTMVSLGMEGPPLSEYTTIAKSLVISNPVTRTGWTLFPYPLRRPNSTQDLWWRLVYASNVDSNLVSSRSVGCLVTSAAPRLPASSNEKSGLFPGGLGSIFENG